MSKIRVILCIFPLLWGLFTPSQAALNLELTQGIHAAVPIGIVPFKHSTKALSGDVSITEVISQDLEHSGEFRVKALSDNDLSHSLWHHLGVDDVLTGSVHSLGFGRYRVSFQLMSAYDALHADHQTGARKALLSRHFEVSKVGLREVAHHISDLIYAKLTGVRGIFSTKIAYILETKHRHSRSGKLQKQYALEVADADGFNPQQLLTSTQPIMSPTWLPNGQAIAYVSFEGHKASIYLQHLASGKRELLSQYPGINGAPAFAPDGKAMAMVLTKSGYPKIYVTQLGTHKLQQITHGYSIDTEPAFSPDGQSIVFTSNRGGSPQIYQYSFSTRKVKRLTFDGNYNARAHFLPDGQSIVLMHRGDGQGFSIAKLDLKDDQLTLLSHTGTEESPSVAPNGKMVLYATQYHGQGVLGLVSTNGKIQLRLPSGEGSVREPSWSPFLKRP